MSVLFASSMAPGFLNGGLLLAGGRPSNYLSLAQQIETQLGVGAEPAQVVQAIAAEVGELEVHEDLSQQYAAFRQLISDDPAQSSALATPYLLYMIARDTKARIKEIDPKAYAQLFELSTPAERSSTQRRSLSQADVMKARGINREMTILFADVVGFSGISAGELPAELNRIMNEIFELFGDEYRRFGGMPWNWEGDKVDIYFGLHGQENHALAAVRSALAMQKVLTKWNQTQKPSDMADLHVRIGIHPGSVTYGPVGDRIVKRFSAYGNTVNTAARLEPKAVFEEDGVTEYGIVVSQDVLARLSGHDFDFDPLGTHALKGIPEPLNLFRIRHESPALSLIPRGAEQVSFTGRVEELAAIHDAYTKVEAEEKLQMLVVSAKAGQGKTRLADQFLNELGDTASVMIIRGEDRESRAPYEAIAQAIRAQAKLKPGESAEQSKQRVRYLLESLHSGDTETEKRVQLLWRLLDLPFEATDEEVKYLLENEQELWPQILNTVLSVFEELSLQKPMVLVLEDLHWMGPGTLKFIEQIKEHLADKPVYLLGLTRPEFFQDDPELLEGENVQTITVGSLDVTQLRSMAAELIGIDVGGDATLIDRLLELSGRNTYLTLEMAAAIKKGWELKEEDGEVYFLVQTKKGKERVSMTKGALDFLQARIDLLDQAEQDFIHMAAVIGPEFTLADIQGLAAELRNTEDSPIGAETLEAISASAEALTEFLIRDNFVVHLDEGGYGFPHALMRETAYGQIVEKDCTRLHQAMASFLVRAHPSGSAIIASHYEKAGDNENAFTYYRAAAEAVTKSDLRDAVHLFLRACDQTDEPKKKFRVLRGASVPAYNDLLFDVIQEIDERCIALVPYVGAADKSGIHLRRGRVLIRSARLQEGEVQLLEGLSILDAYSSDQSAFNAPSTELELQAVRASILIELAHTYGETARPERSVECFQQAYDASIKLGNELLRGKALWGLGYASMLTGDYAGLIHRFKEVFKIFRSREDTHRMVGVLEEWGLTYLLFGNYKIAHRLLEYAVEQSHGHGGMTTFVSLAYTTLGRVVHRLGRIDEAVAVLEKNERENPIHGKAIHNMIYLADAYLGQGRVEQAGEKAAAALQAAKAESNVQMVAVAKMIQAKVFRQQGKFGEALHLIQDVMGDLDQGIIRAEFDLEVLLEHARISLALGGSEEAWRSLNRARTILSERMATIDNDRHRQSFLGAVPVNREILRLWEELHDEQSGDSDPD